MELLNASRVLTVLSGWVGQPVWVHVEVNPGAYWRGAAGTLRTVHIKGDGPFRMYVEVADGLIQVDDLTHMDLADGLVVVIGFGDSDRLARTLEISTQPLALQTPENVVDF
ncbi:MAG: DUF1806 family protein [Firmicutes bacterium]|nr:DUF1806 family protein [Bacillota bacterium]